MSRNKIITIGFDAKRIVRNVTGLGNYSRTLVNNLIKTYSDKYSFRLYAPDKGRDDLRQQIEESNNVSFVYPRNLFFGFERNLWRKKDIVKDLKHDHVDIYHGLSGELPIGLKKKGIHGIVTIHDLIFFRFPQYYHWIDAQIYKHVFRSTCKEAEHFIAISECTKRDIIEFGHVDPDKISVVYQGCNDAFKQSVDEEKKHQVRLYYGLPERYILNVGSIEERKNILLAIKALRQLPEEVSLVIAGKQTPYENELLEYIEENKLHSRVLIIHNLGFEDLLAVYQMAEVFVYPSRYEGFGIPIIEAINCGLPVVACTGSCLEEAGGPDNIYVSPDDVDALAAGLTVSLKGSIDRNERIARSKDYVKHFNTSSVTEQVVKLYERFNPTLTF
jgi:glycosyltransferase involved in cell wall biosynthesis